MNMNILSMSNGYFSMFIAVVAWGVSSIFIEFALPFISAIPFLALRFLLAVLFVSVFILPKLHKEVFQLLKNKWIWIIGSAEASGLAFQYFGQAQHVSAGLSALLSLCFIIFVPFLAFFILHEPLDRYNFFIIVIAIVGIFFISYNGSWSNLQVDSTLGIIFLLLSALSYGIYIVSTDKLTIVQDINTFALFFTTLLIVAIENTLFAFSLNFSFKQFLVQKEVMPWLLGLVLISTIIAFLAYFDALQSMSANLASILLLGQVFVPFFIEYFFLDRQYSLWALLGIILIIVAMLFALLIPYFRAPIQSADV